MHNLLENSPFDIITPSPNLSRRTFLKTTCGLGLVATLTPTDLWASQYWDAPREIWAIREATGEEVKAVYWADGKLVPDGYLKLCRLFRDVKQGTAVHMDPVLMDVMRGMRGYFQNIKYDRPLLITSGYRSKKTNDSLLKEGAAKNSMHLQGKAIDLRMDKIPAEWLARLALYFKQGGVGLYDKKAFVHIDTGTPRVWRK